MTRRVYGAVALVGVVLVASVAVVSAVGVPLGNGESSGGPGSPAGGNATTISYEGSHLSLAGAPDQRVTGDTDVAPGTNVSVRLVTDDAANPFVVQETARVADDGSFAVRMDLGHVEANTTAWATVVHDGTELTNVSARLTPVASATPSDDGANGDGSGTTVEYDGERLTLAALENETVSGESDRAPGTELTVRLVAESGGSPFLRSATATVADDGTFATTVDLVGVANGTTFSVTVRDDGETVTTADGVVIGGDNDGSSSDSEDGNWTRVPVNETDGVAAADHNTTLTYEGDRLTLDAAPNETVSGETDLAPGTTVAVRLESTDTTSPYLKSATATVSEDGRFVAVFNTSSVPPGGTFEVTVRHDGDTIALADGTVAE